MRQLKMCWSVLLLLLFVRKINGYACTFTTPQLVTLTKHEQEMRFYKAKDDCLKRMRSDPYPPPGLHCNRTFDDLMCWPESPAGSIAKQKCPDYINDFNPAETTTKLCLVNGSWFYNASSGKFWTNFSECTKAPVDNYDYLKEFLPVHLRNIQTLYRVGYGVSLGSLLIAVFLMTYFKGLHCQRNTIHINLFVSFILRSAICIAKDADLPADLLHFSWNSSVRMENRTHWQCKLLFSAFHYILAANYMWIMVEGLYLHMLIFYALFNQKKLFKWYILFGWCSPLLAIVPWILVRIYLEDSVCWNTHDHKKGYYWIIRGPIIASIVINFFFFINIIRVLFTKLMASNTRDPRRYRKLAKSTLVLIPLFGVHYLAVVALPDCMEPVSEVIRLYIEMFLNSFQGFLVALLFCFLNGEVRAEISKVLNRYRFRTGGSSKMKVSRTMSTGSFYLNRDRSSAGMGLADMSHRGSDTAQRPPVSNGLCKIDEDHNCVRSREKLNGDSKKDSVDPADGGDIVFSRIAEEYEESSPMVTNSKM